VRGKEIRQLSDAEAPLRRLRTGHPDADAEGYVNYPNVNVVEEISIWYPAPDAYQANARLSTALSHGLKRFGIWQVGGVAE
jgi:flagellar basal-body rod protein FlgC